MSQPLTHGLWGPPTATLDWCEANYQFSPYVAEMSNTFSNLISIGMAVYGALGAHTESLPARLLTGYIGFGLVGVGSFAFHATLLFQAQLADELPMIYLASYILFLLFDTEPVLGQWSPRTGFLLATLAVLDILFTYSYYIYRNPVYHQIVFAALIPAHVRSSIANFFSIGAFTFALGFLIWNLDNIFCDTLTGWKTSIGWPLAFLLEGHSWWHVLTGTGSYLMYIGIQYVYLTVKDDYRKYKIQYKWGAPQITRSPYTGKNGKMHRS